MKRIDADEGWPQVFSTRLSHVAASRARRWRTGRTAAQRTQLCRIRATVAATGSSLLPMTVQPARSLTGQVGVDPADGGLQHGGVERLAPLSSVALQRDLHPWAQHDTGGATRQPGLGQSQGHQLGSTLPSMTTAKPAVVDRGQRHRGSDGQPNWRVVSFVQSTGSARPLTTISRTASTSACTPRENSRSTLPATVDLPDASCPVRTRSGAVTSGRAGRRSRCAPPHPILPRHRASRPGRGPGRR